MERERERDERENIIQSIENKDVTTIKTLNTLLYWNLFQVTQPLYAFKILMILLVRKSVK